MPGRLIVFEGGEGAGKSTQLARLAVRLSAAAIRTATWREPGGTPLGDEIRRLLLDPAQQITPTAEALLFMASRAQLVAEARISRASKAQSPEASALPARLMPSGPGNMSGNSVRTVARHIVSCPRYLGSRRQSLAGDR